MEDVNKKIEELNSMLKDPSISAYEKQRVAREIIILDNKRQRR